MKNSTHEYFSSVSSAVEMLRHLFPVQAMVHVGAGDGHAAVQEWQGWNIPHVVLIEADPEYKESLQETTGQHDGWLAVSALIGEQETETEFYEASNPWESGTIPPEKWQGIWPNLTQTASIPLQQLRLESLLKESPCDLFAQEINWANIDCMPALPIIKGAGESVGQWDIIKARVILDTSFIDNMDAGLDEISNYLAQYDFRCVAVTDSHHPAVGEALFVRNWKKVLRTDIAELQKEQAAQNVRVQSQLDQLSKALDKQTRRAEERQNHLERTVQDLAERDRQLAERDRQLGEAQIQLEAQKKSMAGCEKLINELNEQARQNEKTLAEQTRLAEERQNQLDQTSQALAERDKQLGEAQIQLEAQRKSTAGCEKLINELNEQVTQNEKTLAEQTRLAEERQNQLDQTSQALAERDKQLGDVRGQIENLKKTVAEQEEQIQIVNNQLIEKKQIIDEKVGLVTEQQKKIKELQKKIQEFEAGEAELEHRQRLLDEELVKAEAQLTLITDILIREKAF